MPDIINALFEGSGAYFIFLSILKLHRDKEVKGINWATIAFFMTWGYWNLYYYPSLDQWVSFVGGITIVAANTVWLGMMIYYSRRTDA